MRPRAAGWRLRTRIGEELTVSARGTPARAGDSELDGAPAAFIRADLRDWLADGGARRPLVEMYAAIRGHDPFRDRPISDNDLARVVLPALEEAFARGILRAYGPRPVGPVIDFLLPGGAPAASPLTRDAEGVDPDEEPAIQIAGVESPHFVPEVETIKIGYQILGPLQKARAVHLAIASNKQPDRVLARVRVPGPYAAEGSFAWDGGAAVADGFIGLRESPFVVWMILESTSGRVTESERARVAVELDSVELTVAASPRPGSRHEEAGLRDLIKELEANGLHGSSHGRLILDRPVFSTGWDDMADRASFDTYREALADGYRIPLYARLWLKGKDGARKRSAPATTGTRVLWRIRLPDEAAYDAVLEGRGVHPAAKAFMKRAAGHEAAASRPPGGFGAAASVGGRKTGTNPDAQTLHEAGSYFKPLSSTWGFRVPDNRRWDAFSFAGDRFAAGETGVSFAGGRLTGERCELSATVDLEETLDVASDDSVDGAPASQRSNTITIDIWRRINVVRSLKVGAATSEVNLAPVAKELAKAAVEIRVKPGVAVEEIQGEWKRLYERLVRSTRDPFLKHALLPDPGDHPMRFRPYEDYWEEVHQDAGFFGRLWHRILAFFGATDEDTYLDKCNAWGGSVYLIVMHSFATPNDGLTIVKFGANGLHDQEISSFTAGVAPWAAGLTSRTKALFFVFQKDSAPGVAIHEIGHTLFLAHAPGHFAPGFQPMGVQPRAHDVGQVCLMSYHPSKKYLCGLCLLKLSGWNYLEVNRDGTLCA